MKRNRLTRPVIAGAVLVLAVTGVFAFMRSSNQPKVQGAATSPGQRNDLRRADLQTLKTALMAYRTDHRGQFPIVIPAAQTDICAAISATCKTAKLVDLNFLPSTGYVNSVPDDPSGRLGRYSTGYAIFRDKSGMIHLLAPRAEDNAQINLTF